MPTPEAEKQSQHKASYQAFENASEDVQKIVFRILEIEKEGLYQYPPNNKEIRNEILHLIRRTIQ